LFVFNVTIGRMQKGNHWWYS